MNNHTLTKMAKNFVVTQIGKAGSFALFGLLLLTALNSNVRGQSADNFNPNASSRVQAIAVQSDGKVLIGGYFFQVGGQASAGIARLNTDGTRDNSFNPNVTGGIGAVLAIALQTDGKIVIGGAFTNVGGQVRRNIARLNNDGTIDLSFDTTAFSSRDVQSLIVQPDGNILAGGSFGVARLTANGSTDFISGIGATFALELLTDGKVIVGGVFSLGDPQPRHIFRLNTNGTVDTTFFNSNSDNTVVTVDAQPDGKILVGGVFTTVSGQMRKGIARLNSDGTLETAFAPLLTANSGTISVLSLVRQADGKIIIGGNFNTVNGQSRPSFARLNADGTLDAAFNANVDGSVHSLNLQSDGKILVGGNFLMMSGQPRNNIARLYSSELGEGTQPILFTSNRDGNNEIYRMNADGSNQQRLTNSPEGESGGYWSPDGRKILYNKSINSTTSQIWVMNADGTNQTLISETTGLNNLYKWSPNGQKIVFVRRETGGTDQIWTMNADGSNKTRLTNTTTNDHFPDWSPDGSKIAFGRCNASFLCDIFTMNGDGSNQINLTPNSAEDDEDGPQWSKDGSKIIFGFADIDASGQNLISSNVFIMNADGTNRQSLTNATSTSSFAYRPGSNNASISPNGNRIAAARLNRVPTTGTEFRNSFEVSSVGTDGSNLVNLTNNSVRDDFGAWSPDSAKIALYSERDAATGEIYTMNADGSGVVRLTFNSANDGVSDWYRPSTIRTLFDFDGDGKADVSVFRPSNGVWYLQQSQAGFTGLQFGISTDKLTPADYDGDGKTDVAVYRGGTWYLQRSQLGFTGIAFGAADDIPVPADYDGDGKADLAVFRPSNGVWYLQRSQLGFTGIQFGQNGDKPVAADYDGDGKTDVAVNRNGIWYIQRSQLGFTGISFGDSNDKSVPADYDGDGKADVAVFRPSNGVWYLLQSTAGFTGIAFGLGTDIPAAADYDGDGKSDVAVFRNGTWYLNRSTAGFTGVAFGASTDTAVPNAYVR